MTNAYGNGSNRFVASISAIVISATAMLMATSVHAATSCVDSADLPGAQCTSQSVCDGAAATRAWLPNTDCEAQGKVCCYLIPSAVTSLQADCTNAGGACKTSCGATEKVNSDITCPSTGKCCVPKTCTDVSGTCMDAAPCEAGGGTTVAVSNCSGQVCCVPSGSTAGGTAKPAGTTALPTAGTTSPGKGKTVAGYGLINPLGSRSINDIAAAIIKYASGIAGTLMMIFLIWGGVEYMMASDQKSTQAARNRIVWALLGIAVIFFAYILIDAVLSVSSLVPTGT